MHADKPKIRSLWICIILTAIAVSITVRAIYLNVVWQKDLKRLATLNKNLPIDEPAKRGYIYDKNYNVLAQVVPTTSIYINPRIVKDKESLAAELSSILDISREKILKKLYSEKYFAWLVRNADDKILERIEGINSPAIGYKKGYRRVYPKGELLSQVIGIVDIDNNGLEGLELYYDSYLKEEPARTYILKDATQRGIFLVHEVASSEGGYSLVLNIDEVIQTIVERELRKSLKETNALYAHAVVVQPSTGRILAFATKPGYDPNQVSQYPVYARRIRPIADYYEPGSVFKIVTAVAALDTDSIDEEDIIFCENGMYRVGRRLLHDWKPFDNLSFRNVLVNSSNIGITKVAQKLGENMLYEYIKRFGFGEPTAVDLPGETSGLVRDLKDWSKISITSIPMGQEVGVNLLQIAMMASTIANKGILMRPFLVDRVEDSAQVFIKEFEPQPVRQVMRPDVAERIKEIMVEVVERGTGKRAQIKGVDVAGKTGTAQKAKKRGGYYSNKFVSSFVGFAPADSPEIVVAVVLDEPHPYYYGGTVAAPLFKAIAEPTLRYLGYGEHIAVSSGSDFLHDANGW